MKQLQPEGQARHAEELQPSVAPLLEIESPAETRQEVPGDFYVLTQRPSLFIQLRAKILIMPLLSIAPSAC